MTGLIERAEIQLRPIENSWIDRETLRYDDINEFCRLNEEPKDQYEHLVAWAVTLSKEPVGRGVLIRGNHNQDPNRIERIAPGTPKMRVPFTLPFSLFNQWTLKAFNNMFYSARLRRTATTMPLGPFFYPLDSIGAYHRLYGPGGMIQWQALIPSRDAVPELLKGSLHVGGSFLTLIKVMGDHPSAGFAFFFGSRNYTLARLPLWRDCS